MNILFDFPLKDKYTGYYSVNEESYINQRDLIKRQDGKYVIFEILKKIKS